MMKTCILLAALSFLPSAVLAHDFEKLAFCAISELTASHKQLAKTTLARPFTSARLVNAGCTYVCRAVPGAGQTDRVCNILSSQPRACATYPGCTYKMICG